MVRRRSREWRSLNSPATKPKSRLYKDEADREAGLNAGAAIIEAVEEQLRNNNPPEVRATYERLQAEGYSETEAKKLIASALSVEIFYMLKHKLPYNRDRYVIKLQRLPAASSEED